MADERNRTARKPSTTTPPGPPPQMPLTDLVVNFKHYAPNTPKDEWRTDTINGATLARLIFYACHVSPNVSAFFDVFSVSRRLEGLSEICRLLAASPDTADYPETVEQILAALGHDIAELAARVATIDILGAEPGCRLDVPGETLKDMTVTILPSAGGAA
jgi:hypothetical protein